MTQEQIIFVAIVAVTLILFISEKIRIDIAAMLTLLALAATGILTPSEALSGFASEPAIIVASVFIISAALTETGLTERIGAGIARAAGASEWRAILVVMPAVAALAAFSHHLMVTAMMLPIMMRLARVQNLSPSRLLMPMSLAASLGTTLTIFSAPAFLLMNHLLQTAGQETLGVFGITPIGIALVLLAIVYMSLGRWILPKRKARADEAEYLRLDRYYTELIVEPKSRWIGQPMADFNQYYDGRLEVVEWLRNGVPQHNKNRGSVLAEGDVLFVSATPDAIVSVESEPGLALHAVKKYGESSEREFDEAPQLVQVVVAPHSPFIGETIAARRFPEDLQRRGRRHVAPPVLDPRPAVAGAAEGGRPAGAARHAGPVRGARLAPRRPDDGAVLRPAAPPAARPAGHADHRRRRDGGRFGRRSRRSWLSWAARSR